MTRPLLILLLFFSALAIAQEKSTKTPIDSKENLQAKSLNFGGSVAPKKSDKPKDSLQLINHKEATLIDSLWLSH